MTSSPAVSVLMTAFNRERYIAAAIESVLGQTFTDFELLVVDDRSTDRTAAIASSYATRDARVRVTAHVSDDGLSLPHGMRDATFGFDCILRTTAAGVTTCLPPRQAALRESTAAPSPGAKLVFEATAYCKGVTTASGATVHRGVAASDPTLLPTGSVVDVEVGDERYDGIYTVMDTGPAVQGRELDLYMWSCHEALAFGRRPVRITVLRLGWNPAATAPRLCPAGPTPPDDGPTSEEDPCAPPSSSRSTTVRRASDPCPWPAPSPG